MKRFREYEQNQGLILPPMLDDWLPEDHFAHFLSDVIDHADLSSIYGSYTEARGKPPYSPTMMTKVWLYAFSQGIRSARRLEKALYEDVGFRFLSGNQQPDYWTLSNFRRRHHKALGELFVQTVKMAQEVGMAKLGQVAVDGTKVEANASKHSAMSFDRMEKEEKRLKEEVEKYFQEADATDEEEDAQYGAARGDELPEGLRTAKQRLQTIRNAKAALEKEAREKAAAEQEERRHKAEAEGRSFQPRKDPEEAKPDPKAQRNFTDPESRIMVNSDKAFVQAYNAQAAVDADSQIVVASELTNQAADSRHLPALLEQVVENTGQAPQEVSADAGYYSEENLNAVEGHGSEALIPPEKVPHSAWRNPETPRGRIPRSLSRKERMMRKLRTKEGREKYRKRMMSVEPVFGQMKEGRGLRQFLLRGLEKTRSMWRMECAVHNLVKMFRAGVRYVLGEGLQLAKVG